MGAAPVFELHHLLLPGTQAPSLGADGEDAIVLCAHLVQLGAVKLCLLCPELQVDLLVTREEEGPGAGACLAHLRASKVALQVERRSTREEGKGMEDGLGAACGH